MARGRILSTDFLQSYEFSQLPGDAAFAFLLLIPHWDRDGLMDGDPLRVAQTISLGYTELHSSISRIIDTWVSAALVERYPIGNGRRVLFWRQFRLYNPNLTVKREPPSRFPPPPGWIRSDVGLIPEDEDMLYNFILALDPRTDFRKALVARLPDEQRANFTEMATPRHHDERSINHDERSIHHDRSSIYHAENKNKNKNKNKDHDDDGDDDDHQSPAPHHLVSGKGGVQGGDASSLLSQLDDHHLRLVTFEGGALLGLHTQWSNFQSYIAGLEREELHRLILWIIFYEDNADTLENIRNLTGVIRAHMTRKEHPALRGLAVQILRDHIRSVLTT